MTYSTPAEPPPRRWPRLWRTKAGPWSESSTGPSLAVCSGRWTRWQPDPRRRHRGQLHQLSGLAQHPDLAAIVDWPPLLALAVELLSPNVYINHSHLDVHPPHPPTGAHRWHRDNGLMGRDMRLLWRRPAEGDPEGRRLPHRRGVPGRRRTGSGASQSPRHGVAIPHRGAARRSAHPRARRHGRRLRRPALAPPARQSRHSHPARHVHGVQLPVADLARHPVRGRTGVGRPASDPPSAARRQDGRPVLLGLRRAPARSPLHGPPRRRHDPEGAHIVGISKIAYVLATPRRLDWGRDLQATSTKNDPSDSDSQDAVSPACWSSSRRSPRPSATSRRRPRPRRRLVPAGRNPRPAPKQ